MMHHIANQETAPQCTDPATLDRESQEVAGRNFAASFDDDKALFAYYRSNPYYQESDEPRARGFRRFVIQDSR